MADSGIDVSYWNGTPDFTKVVAAGKTFCGIKLTDGHKYENNIDHAQSVNAQQAGLKIFFYHFGHPEQIDHSATDEANFFISVVRKNSIPTADIIPALDIEWSYTGAGAQIPVPSSVSLEAWVKEFCGALAQNGFPNVMLYSNPSYLNQYLSSGHSLGSMPLWLAEYASTVSKLPNGWCSSAIWQYSESGRVDGISGNVDLNTCDNLSALLLNATS